MTVAFIGHRSIEQSDSLKTILAKVVEKLIQEKNADTFLFGSKSGFNDLCRTAVTSLKQKYNYIKRVYIRAEYEFIDESYKNYLLTNYEDTFYPPQVHGAGALSYIKRNRIMIDLCDVLVVYYDTNYIPRTKTKSGTKIAIDYAIKSNKKMINIFDAVKMLNK